jgi:biotin synthase
VSLHVIVGLGETDRELMSLASRVLKVGIVPALFALTPTPGTAMASAAAPPVKRYRRVQLALYLLRKGAISLRDLKFDGDWLAPLGYLNLGDPQDLAGAFMTSGCPGCDRPYYNESLRGPIYNFHRRPTAAEAVELLREATEP